MAKKLSHSLIRRMLRIQATNLMNPATKLISCDELDERVNANVKGDPQTLGLAIAEYVENPGVSQRRKELVKHDVQAVRAAIRQTKLEQEMEFLNPVEVAAAAREIFEKHGDRLFPVATDDERREPRTKWPYLRWFKDCRPSDITAALEERDVGISFEQDARKDLAVLQMAAKKANSSLFVRDATFEEIFS